MSAAAAAPVEFDDVQGLLRFAYKHHTEASFLLLRIRDPAAARSWIAQAPVTNAMALEHPPSTVLQLAFSYEGLRALGVPADVAEGFSTEFIVGMAGDVNRARRLGDVGPNDPQHWRWGAGVRVPHAAALLYAMPGHLADWQQAIEGQCAAGFELIACLSTSDMGGVEPFGFIDGISQPQPDWSRQRPAIDATQLTYTNLGCLGEFLLGYPNEYGLYTPRPLLDPERDAHGILPTAEDEPDQRDLGRNGSYLVLRQLRQDVAGFWQALDRYAGGQADARARLAEAMVGRTLQGEPLVGLLHEAIAGDTGEPLPGLNAFTYRSDPEGVRCPLGAHIRRTNPRNADLPPGGSRLLSRLIRMLGFNPEARALDLVASTRFHRLIRRGREYGANIPPAQALTAPPDSPESGLQFICLGASIERQFEFVQSAWVMSEKFNGLRDEADPLLGNRVPGFAAAPTDAFSIPQSDGPDRRLAALPRFVTVLGGAYFFLPGLRALRFIATVGAEDIPTVTAEER
jgi:deferrochelatase/peroxidase EfeB